MRMSSSLHTTDRHPHWYLSEAASSLRGRRSVILSLRRLRSRKQRLKDWPRHRLRRCFAAFGSVNLVDRQLAVWSHRQVRRRRNADNVGATQGTLRLITASLVISVTRDLANGSDRVPQCGSVRNGLRANRNHLDVEGLVQRRVGVSETLTRDKQADVSLCRIVPIRSARCLTCDLGQASPYRSHCAEDHVVIIEQAYARRQQRA